MKFFSITVEALCATLVREHRSLAALGDGRLGRVRRFVEWQMSQMPDYLQLPMKYLTVAFSLWTLMTTGRAFHRLDYLGRTRVLAHWRSSRIGARRDFIRFYETFAIYDLAFSEEAAHEDN